MSSRLRLFKFFYRPYPWYVAGILLTSVAFVLAEAVSTAVVYPMTSFVLSTESGSSDNLISALAARMLQGVSRDRQGFVLFTVFAGSYVVLTLLNFGRTALTDVFSRVITRDFQGRLFHKYLSSDYQYLLDQQHGTMLFRIITAPLAMAVMFGAVPKVIVSVVKLVLVSAVLALVNVRLTLLMVGLGVAFYAGVRLMSRRVVYRNSSRLQAAHEQVTVLVNEALAGIKEIKIQQVAGDWVGRFRARTGRVSWLYIKNDVASGVPAAGLQIGFMACLLIAVLLRGGGEAAGTLQAYTPLVAVYAFAFLRLAPALAEIASARTLIADRLPYAEAVYAELNTPSQTIADGLKTLHEFRDAIRFDRVSFRYPTREQTLRDVTLVFEKGHTTALVGPSGSGKTTVVDLLIRLFDVAEGAILVDGVDLRQFTHASWLRKIGYVGQETFLLNASVRDNIAFGVRTADGAAVEAAARAANAHEFISALPNGYDTVLGDRGVKLSGGQRQRIAIARALLHAPEILIFDEATSALDSVSEAEVQAAIATLAKSRTVIVIAHRLSTVRNAARIYVLDNGRVVEEGTHDTLVASPGLYRRLYRLQEEQFMEPSSPDQRIRV